MSLTDAWIALTAAIIGFVAFLWVRDPVYRFGQRVGGYIWLR